MKRLAIATLLFNVAATCPATELKGIALGMPRSDVEALLGGEVGEWYCKAPTRATPFVDTFCFKHTTFGGVAARMYLVIYGDAVESVTIKFGAEHYATVAAGLISKFGEAAEVATEKLQNRMGAEFASRTASWKFEDGTLSLKERGGKIDEGAVVLLSNATLNRVPDGKAAASDM